MKLLLNIPQDMTAKFSKVFKVAKVGMDFCRVDFDIFVDKEISQASHRNNLSSEIFRYDSICPKSQNCFSVVAGAGKIVSGDNVMTDIEEALNG